MGYKIFYNKIKYLVFGLIISINSSCIFHYSKNVSPSSNGSTALVSHKVTLKPECKNTLIVADCFKRSVETGLERSTVEIFVEAFVPPIDVSDTCIYGVAAIDVLYRVTAILPRPKITVICALPES